MSDLADLITSLTLSPWLWLFPLTLNPLPSSVSMALIGCAKETITSVPACHAGCHMTGHMTSHMTGTRLGDTSRRRYINSVIESVRESIRLPYLVTINGRLSDKPDKSEQPVGHIKQPPSRSPVMTNSRPHQQYIRNWSNDVLLGKCDVLSCKQWRARFP